MKGSEAAVRALFITIFVASLLWKCPHSEGLDGVPAQRYALIIGVGTYDRPSIRRQQFADNDARAIFELLTTRGGYDKTRVRLLSDTSEQKPTLANIVRAWMWLVQQPGPNDAVFVYWSGNIHIHLHPGSDVARKFLLPSDGDPDSPFATAVEMDSIELLFQRCQAKHLTMIVDAPFSGPSGKTDAAGRMFRAQIVPGKAEALMTCCGPIEDRLDVVEHGHGLFTYHVLRGLAAGADADGDGMITTEELFTYVSKNVLSGSRQRDRKQSPVIVRSRDDFPLLELAK